MRWALCGMAILLSLTVTAQAKGKKDSSKQGTKISSLLPAGEHPDSVLVLEKNDQGQLAPVLLGKMHTTTTEENGQKVEKPDPLAPGAILIIRDIDDATAKGLKVTNGTAQVGGAYIARQNHELEYLGQVDLNKPNNKLAKEFGIHGKMVKKK